MNVEAVLFWSSVLAVTVWFALIIGRQCGLRRRWIVRHVFRQEGRDFVVLANGGHDRILVCDLRSDDSFIQNGRWLDTGERLTTHDWYEWAQPAVYAWHAERFADRMNAALLDDGETERILAL